MPLVDEHRAGAILPARERAACPQPQFGVFMPPAGEALFEAALTGEPGTWENREATDGVCPRRTALCEHAVKARRVAGRRPRLEPGRTGPGKTAERLGRPQFRLGLREQTRMEDHIRVELDDMSNGWQALQRGPECGIERQALVPLAVVLDAQI
jgi:hypothetical protein